MGPVRRSAIIMAVLAVTAAGGAVAYLTAARERDYRSLLARGDAALRDDQTFAAIESYSGAIALRGDSMLAHLRLAETYQLRGDLEEATREFRKASALDPTATRPLEELGDALYQLQRYARAAEAYERFQQLDDRSPRLSYKLAVARYRDGKLDTAMTALQQAIRINDRMADAYYLLGICLREKHRMGDALKAFDHAVALEPGSVPAREELAELYRATGRSADEIEQLQLLAGLDRSHVERQVAVGLAHARAGHGELAVATLGSAVERAPDQPQISSALGQVWLEMASFRSDALRKALDALERVASNPSTTSDTLALYGRALLQDDNPEAAERVLEQATSRYPVAPAAFLHYATAAERQNHFDAARRALMAYGSLVPNDPDLVSRSARIAALSLRMNDAPTAIEWFERALAGSPNDVRLLASLAEAQVAASEIDAARATVARGLEKDPENPQLAILVRRLKRVKS
jgi:tetratricopeptide (TPR) repeat protein